MFKKVLIANRGEIACRIARTCREMGVAVATVHSTADRDALHVREVGESVEIGSAPAGDSYLRIDRIVEAALAVGADAVHPGYGFLAENPEFANAVVDAGLTFIGPSAEILRRFGDKAAAKAEAVAADVPVVAGTVEPSASVDDLIESVAGMPLPLLLKAAAGGGGKGMRVVASPDSLRQDIEAAIREGRSAFGNPNLIVEQYLPEARHIEVQILGDGNGRVIHLFDRECSLQRRHQKVIEEAPVTSLPDALRQEILAHAVRLGERVGYRGLGTVEFIVKDGKAYFLEVNPRIQVEHPVTEEICGQDLVALQIRSVAEGRLPIEQADVIVGGVAVEARLYAEDPDQDFIPSTGKLESLSLPSGLRVDRGIAAGMSVTPYYDPMIAKLIAVGPDRQQAYARLSAALEESAALGVQSNLPLLRALTTSPTVLRNEVHTGSIAEIVLDLAAVPQVSTEEAALAAALWLRARRAPAPMLWTGWNGATGWRLNTGTSEANHAPSIRCASGATGFDIRFGMLDLDDALVVAANEDTYAIRLTEIGEGRVLADLDGRTRTLIPSCGEIRAGFIWGVRGVSLAVTPYLAGKLLSSGGTASGEVLAPMMGQVIAVEVAEGQTVGLGDRLGVMESMKMELVLRAPVAGTIGAVGCAAGESVERDQCLFEIIANQEEAAA